ncbi:MAG: tetratricopeptide repeat protein [Proteobacteria bacterium]|nr:tetratricopeptide repeat protein [Pseudomonadota bacterium]
MLLDWFNTREAAQVGMTLADCYLPDAGGSVAADRKTQPAKSGGSDLQKFLQRVTREAGPLRLNLFKRAKLLNSFKWRLLDRGVDRNTADELTEMVLLQLSGRSLGLSPSDGVARIRSAERGPSRRVPALLADADARMTDGDYAEAASRYQEALALEPRNALAHGKLGLALQLEGKYRQAEAEFRRAIELKPAYAEAYFRLGTVLRWRGNFSASETALRRSIKLDPRNADALVGLGQTLSGLGAWDDTKSCIEKAQRLKPRSATVLCARGWVASIEGRFEEAERVLREAVDVDPQCSEAWAWLADLRRMTPADKDWLQGAERVLAKGVPPVEEAKLRFAMGKYFNDLQSFPRAFKEYKAGNEIYKSVASPYDRAARTRFVDEMIRVYTRERLAAGAAGASESTKPVLVVGMMRSGTSLMEQIIASHPDAAGAGELDFWNSTVEREKKFLQREPPDAPTFRKLADSYLRVLDRRSQQASRVVDKAPVNSDHLGLIHSAFPNARFIYMRRNPIDTCLSCYFQEFASMAAFTLDLSDLAHYYREHHRLIAHWREALPAGTLLEVPYAELIADQEGWSRKVIEFIGLPWDPCCLQFHETARAVVTASNWQVRQRIYSSSVGRWQHYEKFIEPLLELRDLD